MDEEFWDEVEALIETPPGDAAELCRENLREMIKRRRTSEGVMWVPASDYGAMRAQVERLRQVARAAEHVQRAVGSVTTSPAGRSRRVAQLRVALDALQPGDLPDE